MNVITDNSNYEIRIFGKDVVYTRYLDKCEITGEVINEIINKTLKAINYQPYFSFVDFKHNYGDYTNEAKRIVTNHPELIQSKKAEALISNGLPVKMIIRFYLKWNKPKMATQAFSDDQKGIKWLEGLGASSEGLGELKDFLTSNQNS